MFAVIKTGGKQYRIFANQLVRVEKIIGNTGDVIEVNDVLMIGEGDNVIIGTPVVAGAVVMAEIVEQTRARKVIAFKKRRRQNSKRTRGHRQEITILRILEILTDGLKSKKEVTKPVKKEAIVAKETKSETKSVASVKKTTKKITKKEAESQKVADTASSSEKD
ncbi:50S ribosomal protein L21 [Bartonella sp. B35(2025)]